MIQTTYTQRLIVIVTTFAACGFATATAAELHLRSHCQCSGALVTLSDVAEIYASNDSEKSQLASIELFPAPAQGQSRLVRLREIQDVLVQRGVDLRQNRLAGSSSVNVTCAKPPAVIVPKTKPVVVEKSKPEPKPQVEVVVPVRPIARGQVVQASDVQLQLVDVSSASGNAMTDVNRIVGHETVRILPVGRPLQPSDVRSPTLVTRNSIVTVFARTQGIQVRTSAKAMEDGARNDLIKLQSQLDRDEVFIARVVGHKEVEVFSGPPRIESPVGRIEKKNVTPKSVRPVTSERPSLFQLRVRAE